jgi:hypothetical protein
LIYFDLFYLFDFIFLFDLIFLFDFIFFEFVFQGVIVPQASLSPSSWAADGRM